LGLYQLWTSQTCIEDIRRFLEQRDPALTANFQVIVYEAGILVQPNAPENIQAAVFNTYLPVMLDEDDIPVLASALMMDPRPNLTFSPP
jgi:hypothetical protein